MNQVNVDSSRDSPVTGGAPLEQPLPEFSFDVLTPVAFLERSAAVFPDRLAVVDGDRRFTYAELLDRSARLAGVLEQRAEGRPVAVLMPNTHVMVEAHHAVPWSGSAIVTINTRLAAGEVAYILEHSGAAVLLHDPRFDDLVAEVLSQLTEAPIVVRAGPGDGGELDRLLADALSVMRHPATERDLLSINYTSGTTGKPKGVMYHHRGAYLQSLAMLAHTGMDTTSAYLWTVPMFHCNGWCFPWAVTAAAATHVCLDKVDGAEIWRLIEDERVTHFSGAPAVLSIVLDAPEAVPTEDRRLSFLTGGAPPSPTLLKAADRLRIEVTHLYGLTETYGPAVLCDWNPDWDVLDADARSRLRARQGMQNVVGGRVKVVDVTGAEVAADGQSIGEIQLRGNTVMLGYYRDEQATRVAAPDGWFRTGDLGVRHPDGYIELRDRSKDVIISGGENISSIEVEQALVRHPTVLEAAVVGVPDDRWGEVPIAYVTLRPSAEISEQDLIAFVKNEIARYKAPARIIFGDLPRTSTGKIQKFVLRERSRS